MPNLRKWSVTASGNASIAGGASTINWAELQLPGTVNNSMREASAQVRSVYKPSEWGWVEHSSTASVASQTTVKVAANVTADYTQGRRIRLTGGSATIYGDIVSASFTAQTTITLTKDSGSLSASMSIVAVAAVYDKNTGISVAGIGYGVGSGGSVTQITSKSTTVTLNKICGQITMHGAALAAGAIVSFTLNNTTITSLDLLALNHYGHGAQGGTPGAYTLNSCADVVNGSATITVRNNTAGSLSEALIIGYAVIRASIT